MFDAINSAVDDAMMRSTTLKSPKSKSPSLSVGKCGSVVCRTPFARVKRRSFAGARQGSKRFQFAKSVGLGGGGGGEWGP